MTRDFINELLSNFSLEKKTIHTKYICKSLFCDIIDLFLNDKKKNREKNMFRMSSDLKEEIKEKIQKMFNNSVNGKFDAHYFCHQI